MNIENLKKDLAACERKYEKILKGLAEKAELEKKIAALKREIEEVEKEQGAFFAEMSQAGITLDEAKIKLGLSKSRADIQSS